MLEKAKQHFWYIVGFAMLLLITGTCINSAANKISGEVNILENQFERKVESLDNAKVLSIKVIDSLHKVNKGLQAANVELKKENIILGGKIADARAANKAKDEKIKKFTYKQSAEFLAKNYDMPKSVSYTDKGVTVSDSLPNKIIEDIEEKKTLEWVVGYTENKVENLETENANLEHEIDNKDLEITSLNEINTIQGETLDLAKELNDKHNKENKKLKTGRVIDKVLIGAAFVIGILIAK